MPVVPLLVRAAQKEVRIGDTVVPRGSLMTAHFLAMHTSARYWERPKDFVPVSPRPPLRLPPQHCCMIGSFCSLHVNLAHVEENKCCQRQERPRPVCYEHSTLMLCMSWCPIIPSRA